MTKTIVVGLSMALSLGSALAQPTPAPAPTAPAATQPAEPVTQEKATGEGLQEAAKGDTRPWAAGVSPEKQQQALSLFREANQHHNDGLFVKAVELYTEALKSWDHPAISYNLALSLMNLDRPIDVEQSLQKAIRHGAAPLAKDKYDHAKEYLLLIQQQLATVEVTCSKPGAKVSVDGKEVFTVGANGEGGAFKSRVKIGKHTFVAEKPGYNAEIEAPFIGPGEVFRIELKLYTAEELTRYKRRWNKTWFPYAVIAGGVAIGVVGGVLELSASSSYNSFDDAVAECAASSSTNACMQDLAGMRDSGDTKKTLGFIGYGVAGAAIVTGAVLVYLNRSTSYQITADEYRRELRENQNPATSIAPLLGPGVGGVMVHGAF